MNYSARIYIAAPIFSEADRMYNQLVADRINERFPGINMYVPQNNESINNKKLSADSVDIARGDLEDNLNHDDIVIALMDGNAAPGIGTTLEVGYFARICYDDIVRDGYTNKKIIGLYTDSRECSNTVSPEKIKKLKEFSENQLAYLNLLAVGAIKMYGCFTRTIDEMLDKLEEALEPYKIMSSGECCNDL